MSPLMVLLALLSGAACASQPGRDGPGRPTSDTTRYPGEATEPLGQPEGPGGATDSTRVWR